MTLFVLFLLESSSFPCESLEMPGDWGQREREKSKKGIWVKRRNMGNRINVKRAGKVLSARRCFCKEKRPSGLGAAMKCRIWGRWADAYGKESCPGDKRGGHRLPPALRAQVRAHACARTSVCVCEAVLLMPAPHAAVAVREQAPVWREAGAHGALQGVCQPGCIYPL